MTKPKVHLVVTCVRGKQEFGRKVHLPVPASKNTIDVAYEQWIDELRGAMEKQQAKDVYMGATWRAALDAFAEINISKFDPHLWIVSCGYGLIHMDDEIATYGLTFKRDAADSLCPKEKKSVRIELAKKWWGKLMANPPIKKHHPSSLKELINGMGAKDSLLMAAGIDYYDAVEDDLAMASGEILGKQCCFICKPDLAHKLQDGNSCKGKTVTWDPSGHCSILKTLKQEFGSCNKTQILNRSAQYLIRHFVNKEVELSDWPEKFGSPKA